MRLNLIQKKRRKDLSRDDFAFKLNNYKQFRFFLLYFDVLCFFFIFCFTLYCKQRLN